MPKKMEIKTVFTAYDRTTAVLSKMQARVSKTMARMNMATRAAARGINNLSSKLTRGLKYGFAALSAAGYGAYYAIERMITSIAALKDLTDAINFPIEEFQEWGYVAKLSGVNTEQFQKGMAFFTKNISAATFKIGPLYTALKKADPKLLKMLKGTKSNAEAFDLYIDAMRKAPTEFKRNLLGLSAFGRGSTKLVNITKMTAEEVEALRAEFRASGLVTEEMAASAAKYDDTMDRVKTTLAGLFVTVLEPMLPILTDLLKQFRDWAAENRELISEKTKAGLKWLVENFAEIVTWAKRIAIAVAAFYALQVAINAVNAAVTVASALSNPYVLIAVAFVAAIGAIWYFRDEIDAFMAYFFDWCAEVGAAFTAVWDAAIATVEGALGYIQSYFELGITVWTSAINLFRDIWNGNWQAILDRVISVFESLKVYFFAWWEWLKSFYSSILDGILFAFGIFKDLISGDFDSVGEKFRSVWQGIKDTAAEAFKFILSKIGAIVDSPPFKLLAKILGVNMAIFGQGEAVPNVAGGDPGGAGGAMAGSGPMLPPEAMSSQGGNYNETYDTSIQQSTVVIEDKTGRAKPKRGRLPQGVTLNRSAAFR